MKIPSAARTWTCMPHIVAPFERGMIMQVLCKKSCNFIIALKSYKLTPQT